MRMTEYLKLKIGNPGGEPVWPLDRQAVVDHLGYNQYLYCQIIIQNTKNILEYCRKLTLFKIFLGITALGGIM